VLRHQGTDHPSHAELFQAKRKCSKPARLTCVGSVGAGRLCEGSQALQRFGRRQLLLALRLAAAAAAAAAAAGGGVGQQHAVQHCQLQPFIQPLLCQQLPHWLRPKGILQRVGQQRREMGSCVASWAAARNGGTAPALRRSAGAQRGSCSQATAVRCAAAGHRCLALSGPWPCSASAAAFKNRMMLRFCRAASAEERYKARPERLDARHGVRGLQGVAAEGSSKRPKACHCRWSLRWQRAWRERRAGVKPEPGPHGNRGARRRLTCSGDSVRSWKTAERLLGTLCSSPAASAPSRPAPVCST
jgi:hypothetical protein